MLSEHWERIEKVFAEAAQRSADERTEYLDAECGEDPELRSEIERLLHADERAGWFLEETVEAGAAALSGDIEQLRIGHRVGPYRLVRRLGRGGMSSVYLAERDDEQFRKRVAIKIMRRGMDTEDIARRFRSERQILASLDHPNIARLHDGGTTRDGLPFFVMEYIDGKAIDTYCNEHQLTVRQRLALMLPVLAAVHYAHRNLVVHRDLKPSNLLVTATGAPKLLDFGIAKLLNPELTTGNLASTRRVDQLLTPNYASPEQVAGGAITTASDVYSLGVLIYELLTGALPYRLTGSLKDMEHAICDQVPEAPGLGADVDNIVLMALRKEPSRRYGSVEQLAEDIERYLAGRPIIARRDTLRYRASKFVQRHRLGVATAVAGLLVMMGLIVALIVQSMRVVNERDRAERERDRATRVSAMVKDMFEIADPGEVRGSTITARELLDRGAAQLAEFEDEPETAILLDTLARLYEELGLFVSSIPLRERSLSIYRGAFGSQSAEVARALANLGRLRAWRGDFARAEPVFREALEIRRLLHGNDHRAVLWGINNLGLILHDLGDYRAAAPLYREGLEIQQRIRDEDEAAEGFLLGNQALLLYDLGEYQRAEGLYRQVLKRRTDSLGARSELTAAAHDELGMTLHARGLLDEAFEHLEAGLDIRKQLGEAQDRDVARSRSNLGRLLVDRGELDEAERLLRASLERRLALMGEDHPEVAASLKGLAALHLARGEAQESERLHDRVLRIYEASLPDRHPLIAEAELKLGELLMARDAFEEAEPHLRQAVEIRQSRLGEESWKVAEAILALRSCLTSLDRNEAARGLPPIDARAIIAELGDEHQRSRQALTRLER
ncbi:MAG: serine/threonine-protein kinase [Acidobacteriota bacterium]